MKRISRLKNHPASNCHIVKASDGIDFISYTTRVISIRFDAAGNRMIECTGTYSPTTRRQIVWFLREYAPDLNYYRMKEIAGKGFVAA